MFGTRLCSGQTVFGWKLFGTDSIWRWDLGQTLCGEVRDLEFGTDTIPWRNPGQTL